METGRRPDRRAKKLGKRCVKSAVTVGVQKSRKILSQEIKAIENAHIEGSITNPFVSHCLFNTNHFSQVSYLFSGEPFLS